MPIQLDLSPAQVLDLPLAQPNDADATTIRDYLLKLLEGVWKEGEGFNGKRPFGNSSWESDLHKPLIAAGLVPGHIDEDGYIEDVDDDRADAIIAAAIGALRHAELPRAVQQAKSVAVITEDCSYTLAATGWRLHDHGHLELLDDEVGVVASFSATRWIGVWHTTADLDSVMSAPEVVSST